MRRFITYLYEYKDGQRIKSAGFIRVDVQGLVLQMQTNVKMQNMENRGGKIFLYTKKEQGKEILLSEISLCKGEYIGRITVDLKEKQILFPDIIGVGLSLEDGMCIASCWKDGEEAWLEHQLCKGFIEKEEKEEKSVDLQVANVETIISENIEPMEEPVVTYCKIDLNGVHMLPSKYWHYTNNSFLIHGFWNYGYLVLKESMEANEKKLSLGVPGIYEEPEKIMAMHFGFPFFEALPKQLEEIENQQTQEVVLGCWFVDL